jgi:hypothetical protein
MEILLEKIMEPTDLIFFQSGMRGTSFSQGTPVGARFIWRDDRWWHLLIDPQRYQPVWIRVKLSNLENWTPDLADPATSGIILNRISNSFGLVARFKEESLLLEDGRSWSGESRLDSIRLSLLREQLL